MIKLEYFFAAVVVASFLTAGLIYKFNYAEVKFEEPHHSFFIASCFSSIENLKACECIETNLIELGIDPSKNLSEGFQQRMSSGIAQSAQKCKDAK